MECKSCSLYNENGFCEKIGGNVLECGYCFEQGNVLQKQPTKSKIKRNMNYRKKQKYLKDRKIRNILDSKLYTFYIGHITGYYNYEQGVYIYTGTHVKYSSRSRCKRYMKRATSKRVRKNKYLSNGNQYRRLLDYWWILFETGRF